MIQPCPHCGNPLVVLPSGQIVSTAAVDEISMLIERGDEFLEALHDPDQRAVLGEHFPVEDLDEDD